METKYNKKIMAIIGIMLVLAVVIIAVTLMAQKTSTSQKKLGQSNAQSEEQQTTQLPTDATAQSGMQTVNVGETITFGSYEQDNNTVNGAEPIQWLVLDVKKDKMLIISKYGLDCQPYNTTRANVTWETCTLRNWLNTEFYNTAFNDSEKASVITTTLDNPDNASYGTKGGNATNDNVFCLSIVEADRYFESNETRGTKPTAYAIGQGAYVDTSTKWFAGNCAWWLRSPADYQNAAADVYINGNASGFGFHVSDDDCAVRPALWIVINQ